MLKAPENYLNKILSKENINKDVSGLILKYILSSTKNLHFIIDEKYLDLQKILTTFSLSLSRSNEFEFKIGQRIIQLKDIKRKYTQAQLRDYHSPYSINQIEPKISLSNLDHHSYNVSSLKNYIPVTGFEADRVNTLHKRIDDYNDIFTANSQEEYLNHEKLLIIGNKNLFQSIPVAYPACFVYENESGNCEIEYNSPILPKITILKNIKLMDDYIAKETNGKQINFKVCIFVGDSKFENSINLIRNYNLQGKFNKIIFLGKKDIKIDLGNNEILLRWKWTIPEIIYLQGRKHIEPKSIIIQNTELENTTEIFYHAIKEIEIQHTISLKPIFRYIRRLYFDWSLNTDTTYSKLDQIQKEFEIALEKLLIDTLGGIFLSNDFNKYSIPLKEIFDNIVKSIKINNKAEILKNYKDRIDCLILPSFLCKDFETEINSLINQIKLRTSVNDLKDLLKLPNEVNHQLSNPDRNYFALTANGKKTEITTLHNWNNTDELSQNFISSIYGVGKIDKLIEKLYLSTSDYSLLLYSIEEKIFRYHIENYISELNGEYNSQDRFDICGVPFSDTYYQFSDYDELIEALASFKNDHAESDSYKITFNDQSDIKLPLSKSVLKILRNEKIVVQVIDLCVGDKVQIYANPDKKLLRDIMELTNPDLFKKAEELSSLWKTCLREAYQSNIMSIPLYEQLVANHFSVSEFTFKKYLDSEVMFPRSFSDLVVIAKTINDPRLSFDFIKNAMKPKIEEYRGKEIEYGFKFSNGINNYIISGEIDNFLTEWLKQSELDQIVTQIPKKTIKNIELITIENTDE